MARIKQIPAPEAVERGKLYCHRCGNTWWQKVPGVLPATCPRCKNPRWNIPRPEEESGVITASEQTALDAFLWVLRHGTPKKARALKALIEMEAEETPAPEE